MDVLWRTNWFFHWSIFDGKLRTKTLFRFLINHGFCHSHQSYLAQRQSRVRRRGRREKQSWVLGWYQAQHYGDKRRTTGKRILHDHPVPDHLWVFNAIFLLFQLLLHAWRSWHQQVHLFYAYCHQLLCLTHWRLNLQSLPEGVWIPQSHHRWEHHQDSDRASHIYFCTPQESWMGYSRHGADNFHRHLDLHRWPKSRVPTKYGHIRKDLP